MANGYALVNYFDQTVGSMYWNISSVSGLAEDPVIEENKLTLSKAGFLGLGSVNDPHGNIHLENSISNRKIILWETANNINDYFGFGINGATLRYNIPSAGGGNVHRFFAGTSTLFTIFDNGNATLAGTLTQLSDARLKKNIVPITSALNSLNKLNAYTYNWIDKNKDSKQQIGVLAQEIQKVYPQLVNEDEQGNLSVNYMGLTPILLQSIKELSKKSDDLQKQINELRLLIRNK